MNRSLQQWLEIRHFSYIVNETLNEEFVSVPEQGGGKIIPEGIGKPGHVYTVGRGDSGMIGVYKVETEVVTGTGKFERSGLGSCREAKENPLTAFNYFKANNKNITVHGGGRETIYSLFQLQRL